MPEKKTEKRVPGPEAAAVAEIESEEAWDDMQAVLGPRIIGVGDGARGALAVALLALRGGLPVEARMTRQQAVAEMKAVVDAVAAEAIREDREIQAEQAAERKGARR